MTLARPRDERIDFAVLTATRQLLGEVGYSSLTIEAVAARAGTTRPAIRRRWPSQKHLVVDTITQFIGSSPTPDTGCTHCDLVAGIESLRVAMSGPLLGLTLAPLVTDLRDDPELRARFFGRFFNPRRQSTARAIERGIARGDLRPDVDVDLLLDLLASTMIYRLMFGHLEMGPGLSEEIVRVVMCGIVTPHWVAHHADSRVGAGR